MNSGIYKITNLTNKKFYIGSAVNFHHRKRVHLHDLRKNKHHSIYLQRAFNKYGEKNFVFELIAKTPKEYLLKLEQWFINNLKPKYNIAKIAGSTMGIKLSEKSRKKMSESGKGRITSDITKEKISKANKGKKKIFNENWLENIRKVRAEQGHKIKDLSNGDIYINIRQLSRTLGINYSTIFQQIRDGKNDRFKYLDEKKNKIHINNRKIKIIDSFTNIVYGSIAEASRSLNIAESTISLHISKDKRFKYYTETEMEKLTYKKYIEKNTFKINGDFKAILAKDVIYSLSLFKLELEEAINRTEQENFTLKQIIELIKNQ